MFKNLKEKKTKKKTKNKKVLDLCHVRRVRVLEFKRRLLMK